MNKCKKCPKPAKTGLKHLGPLCTSCFCKVIEKRVRKTMRENSWIKHNDEVFIVDNGTVTFAVTKYLLERISKDLPMEINIVKEPCEGKVIIPWSLDDEVTGKLQELFGEAGHESQFITLLQNVSDEEIQTLAKLKDLEGSIPGKNALGKKLAEMEQKYPGSKFGLMKSFQDLK